MGTVNKKWLCLVRKKLALKDEKIKAMRTEIVVNEGYCVRNINFIYLFLIKLNKIESNIEVWCNGSDQSKDHNNK